MTHRLLSWTGVGSQPVFRRWNSQGSQEVVPETCGHLESLGLSSRSESRAGGLCSKAEMQMRVESRLRNWGDENQGDFQLRTQEGALVMVANIPGVCDTLIVCICQATPKAQESLGSMWLIVA